MNVISSVNLNQYDPATIKDAVDTSDAGLVGKMLSSVPTPFKVGAVSGLTAILIACGSFSQQPPTPEPTPTVVYNTPTPTQTPIPTPTPEPSYIPNSPEGVRVYLTWAFNLADNYWKRKAETGEDRIEDIELAYKIGGDVAKGIAIRNADDPEMLHVANIICLEHTSVMNEEKRLDLENRKIEISEEFQGMFQNLTYRIDFLRDNVLIQCLFHVRDKYKK